MAKLAKIGSPMMALFAGPPDHRDDPHRLAQPPWRRLRALRHQPPGWAARGKRQKVFNAALEQSEQLFSAAASIDYATRPILAFYGVSQAGRAIAAAAKGFDAWQLYGHGIKATNLDQEPYLSEVVLRDEGQGSFVKIAELLSSATLGDGVKLSFLWGCIPELYEHRLSDELLPNALTMTTQAFGGEETTARLKPVPDAFLSSDTKEEDIASFLGNYPSLAGFRVPMGSADLVTAQQWYASVGSRAESTVLRSWETPQDRDARKFWKDRTVAYRHEEDRWVFPAPPNQKVSIHPLIAWWAILYTLSMVARYHPSIWVECLNVNKAATAVPLELVLDAALEVCPQLILRAIDDVAT